MSKITFIVGGARSGKSTFAAACVRALNKKIAFIATGEALDKEMRRRILAHKKSRPVSWDTFEEPYRVASLLKEIKGRYDIVIIDCLTLLVSNLMGKGLPARAIEEEMRSILEELAKSKVRALIVSNEVGLGIVPASKLGRDFRDIAGRVNQITAAAADEVFFMVSGIPWSIK